jgi:hypothetical protein
MSIKFCETLHNNYEAVKYALIHISIYLSIYLSTFLLLDLDRFSVS